MPERSVSWRVLRPGMVETPDGAVELTARAQAVLLALLLDADVVVTSDRLAEFVWGERPPATARNSIARFVADLRTSLGGYRHRILTAPGGYRVDVRPGELDWDAAQEQLAAAREVAEVDDARCREALARAMELLGPGPIPMLADHPGLAVVRRLHDEARIEVLDRYAELHLRCGQHREVIPVLERAVDAHPYHERFWAQLMVALDRSGRTTEALRAYRRLCAALADLGTVPSEAVRDLELGLLRGRRQPGFDAPGRPARRLPARGSHAVDPPPALVGRDREVAEVLSALRADRLVSIVGIGGVGKTRVARSAADGWATAGGGCDLGVVHRVALREVGDADAVVATIAAAVGVPASSGATDGASLARALGPQPLLLLLDGCERLEPAGVEVIESLVAFVPGMRVLATSRVALGVPGERVLELGPLGVPPAAEAAEVVGDASAVGALDPAPALALFLQRAGTAGWVPGDGSTDVPLAGGICWSLGGVPLALEIAAAQLAHMTLAALRELVARPEAEPGGQEAAASSALATVLDGVWEALEPAEQALLARVSVFVGGWTEGAVDAVCVESGSAGVALTSLVERGLVDVACPDGAERYSLAEPVRAFAAQRLAERGETAILRDRLVGWIASLTERWGVAELHAWAEPSIMLRPEHGNVTAALGHLRDRGRTGDLVTLAVRSTGLWINHGTPGDVLRWLGPIADAPELTEEDRCAAAAMLMEACHARGDLAELGSRGITALELAAGRPFDWMPAVAGFLGVWSHVQPVPRPTEDLLELSASLAERSRSRDTNLALAAVYRGHLEFGQRRYEPAAASFARGRRLARHPGRLLLLCEVGEGLALSMAGHHDEAVRTVGGWRSHADTDVWHYVVEVARALIVGAAGQPEEATAMLAAAVRRLPAASVWGRADDLQMAFGVLADLRGEHELAAELLATPVTRHLLLATVVVEHVAASRGLRTDAERVGVAIELWTRVFPEGVRRGDATSIAELNAWWSTGGPVADVGADVGAGLAPSARGAVNA